ncbi:MetQ/NlpA family ABC transporter substrate-binding protein [Microbacterium sp. NPDC058342]|uniref:MetQ/NlpA family ABC transporter substrate-binding protein n=1 Tax=Microbacterium sp. NPDC058342 TaxID=3346454 RepID=UPI003668089C
MSRRITTFAAAAAAATLIASLAGCASNSDGGSAPASGGKDEPVRIGVVGKSDPQWPAFVEAAEKEGIDVELVDFGSYELPNPALTEGEIDLNQFQHVIYLAQYNEASGEDLAVIGSTQTYPLGLYSSKYDDVKDIKEGETVAVPDDASNQARGLLVLQSAGLIELADGGSPFSDLSDVDEEKSKVKVTALEAALTPEALPDVAAAIVNNDFVEGAGLSFDDALFTDDASDPAAAPYVNIFAARSEDVDDETYLKLVDIFQTDEAVQKGLAESSGGTGVTVQISREELAKTLAKVQQDVAADN